MTCPAYCEELLRNEIEDAGGSDIKTRVRSVTFGGTAEVGYRLCLNSAYGNGLYRILAEGHAERKEEIVRLAAAVAWEEIFPAGVSFSVSCKLASNNRTQITDSRYGALLLKDGVCDRLRTVTGCRPDVDTENPDIRLHLQIVHAHVMICVNWAGEPLNRRGYRPVGVEAPLKENTAAAVLARCRKYTAEAGFIVDPMCGSGTLLIEAAMAAAGIPPGLLRSRRSRGFGFQALRDFDREVWSRLRAEAEKKAAAGNEAAARTGIRYFGFDIDRHAAEAARQNAAAAGLSDRIVIRRADFRTVTAADFPADWSPGKTCLIVNPPYGERLGDKATVPELYRDFGNHLRSVFPGSVACILCGDASLAASVGLKAAKTAPFRNGALKTVLAVFPVFPESRREASRTAAEKKLKEIHSGETLSEGSRMFANRLKKNSKEWKKSAIAREVSVFRLYDADMPEYNASVDVYIPVTGNDCSPRIYLSEYQPPSSVSEESRKKRLNEMIDGLLFFFETDRKHLYLRTRFRQKNGAAYEKLSSESALYVIEEEGLRFEVNLSDYLDTGIYPDHRPLRRRLKKEAKGKRFLNLFSYTATASVCAAAGGAVRVVSVDASARYLETGKRNFGLNGIPSDRAVWIRNDVMKFLREDRSIYDLIYLDPPTFSNSKSARDDFDLQKDQSELIDLCMQRLSKGGVLYFSNHFRRFVPDEGMIEKWCPEEITESTFDPDFRRNRKIHRCWRFVKK